MMAEYTVNEGESLIGAGRASLFSSYNKTALTTSLLNLWRAVTHM